MRGLTRRSLRDGLAVIALAAFLLACIVNRWALIPAAVCAFGAAVIDPESRAARAREHRRQQRAADGQQRRETAAAMPQRAAARQLYVPIQGSPLECGCVEIPAQLVLCPADAALAEIEQLADGRG